METLTLHSLGQVTDLATSERWDSTRLIAEIRQRRHYFVSKGIKNGDHVVLLHGNNNRFFADLFAIWGLGGCAVCLDEGIGDQEFGRIAAELDAKAVIVRGPVSERLLPHVQRIVVIDTLDVPTDSPMIDAVAPAADRPALILYTSGSTGLPKGVVHTHRSLLAKWAILRERVPIELCERTLCFLSTSFGHGLICNSLYPLVHKRDLFLLPKGDISTLSRLTGIIEDNRITFMSSVPAAWHIILKVCKPPRANILRQVHIGSAPLGAELWKRIQAWCGTRRVWNMYGITETGSWVAGPNFADPEIEPEDGLVGHAWGGNVMITDGDGETGGLSVLPDGERGYVWLNTAAVMQGYFKRPEATAEVLKGNWFFTGDTGYIDAKDRLVLAGRVRNEINKGGIKISPEAIDLVAETHPAIAEACSFAVDDPILGQNIGICIIPKTATALPKVAELKRWFADRLSPHKTPFVWYQVTSIPKTPRGKVNRKDVAEFCGKLNALA